MKRGTSLLLLAGMLGGITNCELVLGLEEHTLGPIDGGAAGMSAGTAGSEVTAGTSGNGGTGASGGSGGSSGGTTAAAGAGGDTGDGGSAGDAGGAAGAGGAVPPCDLLCEAEAALIHRYRFDGTGVTVEDTVGTADGEVIGGAVLSGTGTLALTGANSNDYVNLPNGIISVLTDATFEAWITWNGGSNWQRIFDFGSSTMGEDMQGTSATSIFATPKGSPTPDVGEVRASFTLGGQAGEKFAAATDIGALPTTTAAQVVVVVDGTALLLYVNGQLEGSVSPIGALAELDDVNNWLGHSQWSGDDEFAGIYDDFRIYDAALGAEVIAALFAAGADL